MRVAEKDLNPTNTLLKAIDALWSDKAMGAAVLFRQLAAEMELLNIANDGEQFAPDLVSAIEDSVVYSRLRQNVDSLDLL
jgi:hypothetical protein